MTVDQIRARVDAIEATNDDATFHGAAEANVRPHREKLIREQQEAVFLLRGRSITERRDLITQLNTRIAAMDTALEAETDVARKEAMRRTVAALRDLLERIRESGGIPDAIVNTASDAGTAIGTGLQSQVDMFTNGTTGSRVVQGTMIAATLTGLSLLAYKATGGVRRFFGRLFGRGGTGAAPTAQPGVS